MKLFNYHNKFEFKSKLGWVGFIPIHFQTAILLKSLMPEFQGNSREDNTTERFQRKKTKAYS